MEAYMKGLSTLPPQRPTAILMISAHWEQTVPTVMTSAKPPMLYDYSGFPPHTYQVKWPAPGAPDVAAEVRRLLQAANFSTAEDPQRGYDHGTFVPMALSYPDAEIPTTQLSLVSGLSPELHYRMGQALAPLRDHGVFIVGSGMSYHNMRAFMTLMRGGPAPVEPSKAFDDWLAQTASLSGEERKARLLKWESAPAARSCHPREEHLIPLHVVAGAAHGDVGTVPYRDEILGARVSAVHFG
jgi:aromatic ring-opening dioxygenase catalytic subunit (LigB family)